MLKIRTVQDRELLLSLARQAAEKADRATGATKRLHTIVFRDLMEEVRTMFVLEDWLFDGEGYVKKAGDWE